MTLEIQYYADKPGRDLSICDPGSVVWCDIEPGCFENAADVRAFGTLVTSLGLRYGTYTGRWIFPDVFGASEELAQWPLWYADYRPPDFSTFEPFNGWTEPALWQYWSGGYCGINCDLSVTPDMRLFADISNYTTLTPKAAEFIKYTFSGVVIGLQNTAIAKMQKGMLT